MDAVVFAAQAEAVEVNVSPAEGKLDQLGQQFDENFVTLAFHSSHLLIGVAISAL